MVDNAEKGLAKTCEQTGAIISNYSAAPVFMSNKSRGRHQWLIEFEKEPESLEQFADILDATLRALIRTMRLNDTKVSSLTGLK